MDKLRYPSAAHARPRRTALAVVALLAGAIGLGPGLWPGPARADDDPLARIRRLEGTWLVVDASGQPTDQVASVFRVTANGHSVEEVMFPGSDHEMVNMYYRDVDEVHMTHFCAGGNQPVLRLVPGATPDLLELQFLDISNMVTMNDEHMHEARYQWLGPDRLRIEWRTFRNGRFLEASRIEMLRRK